MCTLTVRAGIAALLVAFSASGGYAAVERGATSKATGNYGENRPQRNYRAFSYNPPATASPTTASPTLAPPDTAAPAESAQPATPGPSPTPTPSSSAVSESEINDFSPAWAAPSFQRRTGPPNFFGADRKIRGKY